MPSTTIAASVSTADGVAPVVGPTSDQAVESAVALPAIEDVLAGADCYATMEPCSIRTSGGPSCALELVRAKVRRVYLGVEEPLDFVKCEGVEILEKGGVRVERVRGLEEQCLKAARRGRS
jgi:pyrimidine deaminase RibD-like protein